LELSVTREHIVTLDRSIREEYLIDVVITNNHFYSTIREKPQKYTDLKEELTRIWQLNVVYIEPLMSSTKGIVPNKIHTGMKLLYLCPGLYILM
jgi:hypothetical protein